MLLTVALVIWTFALPRIPQPGEHRPASFTAWIVVFFLHWSLLSIVAASSLWRAGSAQPTVARRRMQFLALATGALTIALLLAILTTNQDSSLSLGSQVLATVSVVAFFLGFAPPQLLRIGWRRPEQARVQQAIASLLAFAESQEEVASRVLEPAAAIVGARAIAIRNAEGRVVAAWNVPAEEWATLEHGRTLPRLWDDAELVDLEVPGGSLILWTSPYAPFFGDDELALLRTVGALTGLALDRVRLFQAERETRLALERANEVKMNFIALAAHELRTPVTTIHGFVTTLHHVSNKLTHEQRETVRYALLQQTQRMASLVEQLLDLSRLDAEAVEIRPQGVDLRLRLQEVVEVAAGARVADVKVEVTGARTVRVDPSIVDHIVTNLVTNALRYGQAPVRVIAVADDDQVRIVVEDAGPGVAKEIEETLFERFTRAGVARDRVAGTGLGLAIARAYARAHRGDLRYERRQPTGSRFVVELPTG